MATKSKPNSLTTNRRRRAAVRQFSPNRPVILLSEAQVITLKESQVSPDRVGWKAHGLSCLPPEWVPPFFVIEGCSGASKAEIRTFDAQIQDCLARLKLDESQVIVRSSGTMETIEQRGRLVSRTCAPEDIAATVRDLADQLSKLRIKNVHWVVQEYIQPVRQGHLSNERRLNREPRDFVAEFEIQGERPGYTVPVAVRHWRDGVDVEDFDLSCTTEAGVSLTLKRVALWAAGLPSRVLFEWAWTGSRLWLVQADVARPIPGVNPNKLRPTEIPEVSSASLRFFRIASPPDFDHYRKLGNARTYGELGYKMPTFFVLDKPSVIRKILEGQISTALERDLQELTRRPLIIRTDGVNIPPEKREMLPRSEDLRSLAQAKSWLTERFSQEINRIGIAGLPLSLVAHHFIPSIAAAWARSEPSNRMVRIESLWGLPEGLYWHSHDTFEVDTEGRRPIRNRMRFKGTFVAPDEEGRWVHYRPSIPFDWGRSIAKEEWFSEMAKTTRKIAEFEHHAVAVMWLVDNDSRATPHQVLPWYHTESAIGEPKAAPRRKLTMASDFKIETAEQWEALKSIVRAGKRIERVMLEPSDSGLVRNQEFAKELAEFAAANKIVVELAGGILSHAYHILQRHGAQVECIDLFGAGEEEIEYNKLVRDKIPDLIESQGEGAEVLQLKGEALLAALRQKLVEESYEALDARAGDDLIGELADIQEVINGICESLNVPLEDLDAEREEKRRRRGGFRRGLMLRKTSTPHTLAKRFPEGGNPELPADHLPKVRVIEQANLIPAGPTYRRPDLRSEDYQPEALLSFETELSRLDAARQSALFEIPTSENETRSFRTIVELERHHSVLWGQVRVRLEPSQMTMRMYSDSQMEFPFPKNNT